MHQNSAEKPFIHCDFRFYAIKASAYDPKLLATSPNEALFVMERTTWIGNLPIPSVRAVTDPDYPLLGQI